MAEAVRIKASEEPSPLALSRSRSASSFTFPSYSYGSTPATSRRVSVKVGRDRSLKEEGEEGTRTPDEVLREVNLEEVRRKAEYAGVRKAMIESANVAKVTLKLSSVVCAKFDSASESSKV